MLARTELGDTGTIFGCQSTHKPLLASLAYLGLLFGIAYVGDKRADAGRPIIANPYIYSLSLAVYATSWTFLISHEAQQAHLVSL